MTVKNKIVSLFDYKAAVSLYNKVRVKILFPEAKQIEYLIKLGAWILDEIKPIDAVTALIKINAENNKQNSIETEVSQSIFEALDAGKELHVGMIGYFNHHIISMFKSAGTTGLENVLKHLKEDTEELKKLKMTFFKPIFLPLVYSGIMFASSVSIATTTLPALTKGKPIHQWPIEAQQFSNSVYFVLDYWPIIVTCIAFIGFYLMYFLKNNTSKFRRELDELAGFTLYRIYSANVYLKSLSLMLMSNMSLLEALEMLEANSNKYVSWHASEAIQNLDKGKRDLGDVLNTGLISGDILIQMKYLTSTESHLAKVEGLRKTAHRAISVTESKLKAASWVIGGTIILGIFYALITAFLAILTAAMMR